MADHASQHVARRCPEALIVGASCEPTQQEQRTPVMRLFGKDVADHRCGVWPSTSSLEHLRAVELPTDASRRIVAESAARIEDGGSCEQAIIRSDRVDRSGLRG